MSAVIVLMTGSQALFAQDAVVPNEAEPIRRERFANVFDPNSRTYFSLQGTEGKDFGGTQPFASLGATHYTGDIDSAVTLYTGQFMMNYNAINGIPAGSLGAQQRWMTQLPGLNNTILGAGLYVDFTQSRYDNLFQQINLNFELMTESAWVTRFNAYLPVGQNEASTGIGTVAGGPSGQLSVVGTTVGTGGINRQWQDVALMGTDLELGRKFFNYRMEAYAGYYNWNGPLAGFTNGVKGGVRGYITNNLSGNVNISHDQFFGTNVYGGLTYFFGGPGGNRPMSFQNLMTLPAQRLQQVSISNFVRDTSNFQALHDVNSGDELHMYFVKEAGAGTGTQTNPSNVNSVLADTNFGNGSAMVLLDANGNITSPIALTHDRQQIIGGGSTGTADVDFSVALGQAPGTSIVHLSALGGRPVLAPGVAGNAVTLTNQNIVSGFTIDGTGGLTNGISGNPGATDTLINDMTIQNVAGTGIRIQPSTNTTISNVTFLNNGQDILLNAANSTITNISSTNAVNGSINLGGGVGDITGTTLISNVTITNSGGNAILLNNAQNGSVTSLTDVTVGGGTGTGLQVTNSQTGSIYNLTNVNILNVGGNGMLLTNSNGTFNVDSVSSISNTGSPAFGINGGAINVNYGGTIQQGNAASALLVTGGHTGTANFTNVMNSITTSNGDGLQFDGANGTYNLTGKIQMNGGDAGIDIFNSNGTFVFNNPLINNTASGMGVKIVGDMSNAPITTFNGLNITTTSNTGFFVTSGGLTTVNGTANVTSSTGTALDLQSTPLAAVFTNVTSTFSADAGININNASGTFGVSGIANISGTVGNGIQIANSATLTSTIQSVNLSNIGSDAADNGVTLSSAGTVSILGGTIDSTQGDGIHSTNTDLTATGLTIGGVVAVGDDGIQIINTGSQRNVNISNNTITGSTTAITTSDAGVASELLLSMNNNTLRSVAFGTRALNVTGSNFNSTIINSMTDNTIVASGGGGGGAFFTGVTFDASGRSLSGTQVNAGNWTIGTTGSRVQGDGLHFDAPTGDLAFGSLNIANNGGTGLFVNTQTLGTTFSLSNTSGTVDTTNGAAIFLDPLTTNLTFSTVNSTNSGTNGITLDSVAGSVNLGTVNVTNATNNGVDVANSTAAVTIGTVNVNGATTGINLLNNSGGSFTVTGIGASGAGGTIQNVTDRGVLSVNTVSTSLNNMIIDASAGTRGVGVLTTTGTNTFSLTNSTVTGGTEQAVAIGADATGILNATINGNTMTGTAPNTQGAGFVGITSALNAGGGTLNLAFSNNTLSSVQSAGAYISNFNPTSLTTGGTVTVTDFANNVVTTSNVGNAAGPLTGGILINGVTFDSDLSTAGIQTVNGGTLTIGSLGTPTNVVGDGLRLNDVSGDLAFTTTNIGNDSGTGLYVNTKVNSTTFSLSNTGGSINTSNGSALFLDPLTTNMTLTSVTSTNSATNGITLDAVAGTVNIGTVNVTNATGSGVFMDASSAAVTVGALTVNGAANGVTFGTNTGSFNATGTTNISNVTNAGINMNGATGTYTFDTLNIDTLNAARGLDFRNSNVSFTSGNTAITGDGSINGIAIDLSGSQNPNGANSATPNILIGAGAAQTAKINNINTGVLLGDAGNGSAGAYLKYGNQTPLNSGSEINVIAGGVTLDATNLTSTDPYTQGRYEFTGVAFTGNSSFPTAPGASYIFVGATSSGADDGSSPTDRISLAQLLALDATPSNLDNKTIVLVNEDGSPLNMGANSLTLGTSTILDTFTGSNSFTTAGLIIPVNIIVDTFGGAVTYNDPFGQGAATLTNDGSLNLVTLGDSDTIQHVTLSGGVNSIFGNGVAGANINNLTISGSGQNGISLANMTGTTTIDTVNISSVGSNGVSLNNAGTVLFINGSISGTVVDGIHSVNTDLTVSGNTINSVIAGDAVEIVNTGSARSVDISNNNLEGGASAVRTTDGGVIGELTVTLNNNTYASTIGNAINMTGSGLNSTIVTSMNGGTVNNNSGNGGGVNFDRVTFDASGTALSGTTVNANNWNIGANASVSGDGLRLNDVSGNLNFGQLDIANDSGTGLYVNTKVNGTTFTLGNTSGTITTTNGAAVFLDPLTTNLTFDAVNSSNSPTTGITLDTVSGTFNVNGGTITGSAGPAVSIDNSSATTNLTGMNLTGTGAGPVVQLNGNTGMVILTDLTMARAAGTTAFDIDASTGSTGKITIDGTSTIGGAAGTAFLIGAGSRDIDATALAITNNNTTTGPVISITGQSGGSIQFGSLANSGSTASNVINTTGQTGGTTSFDNVLIFGYGDAATDTAVSLTGTGGSVTFSDLDIITANGNGLNLGGITFSGGISPTISATGGSALFANGTTMSGGSQTFDSVTDNGGNYGIHMANITGTTNFTTVNINNTSVDGIFLNNAGTVVLNGGTIDNTAGDGINSTDTNLTASALNIGGVGTITGNGITIANTGTPHTVNVTNTTINAVGMAISSTDSGTAGELVLTLDGNTIQSTGNVAMNITGGALNSTIITSMNNNTVVGNGLGGGVIFNQVTFDASGTALLGTQVAAGDWTVGTPGSRVSGDGMVFSDPTGDLAFGALNIANDTGTGLYVNTKGNGTTFSLSNTSGTIDTTNGSALFLDPLTTNMTFSSVSSTNSFTNGVTLDTVGGSINLGNVTVSDSNTDGILIQNSTATIAFNTTNVTNAGADGIHFNSNTGPINFNGTTTVTGSTDDGIDLSSAGGGVTFNTTNVNNSGAHGINLAGATGTYNFGATNINGFGASSAGVNFDGAAADATFGVTDIQNAGNGTGIDLSSTTGNHTINFATGSNIHNVALGVELSSSHTNATSANATFTFGDGSGVDGNGTNSQINATTTVNVIGLNPALGTYNFNDVVFTGTASLPAAPGGAIFVSATAVNGVGDGSYSNPYSVSDADAITTANTTFAFLDGVYDFNTLNGGHSFSLAATQNVEGFDNGNTVAYGTVQPVNVFGNLGASGGVASRTSSLTITDSAADGIFDLAGGNSLLDITLTGSALTTYLVNSNSATVGFDNTAGISLNGVTMSNPAGSATALQFTNLNGTVSVQGNNINLASGKLLDINGGTATYTIARGTQPDVGNTPGVLSGQSMVVRNTTGGSVSLDGATLATTGTLVTLDNNDATFSFLNNTFTGGIGSTLFDIDTTTGGSTTALTFGNTNTITQTQGRIANIGGGARNIDLSAFNFTNAGTTNSSVINSVGQTGGTISFGTINIAGYNNAAGTAVNLQGSGGTATFSDLDIVTTNGAGLSVGAITFNGGASPTVSANGGTALTLNGTTLFGGGQTFGNVTATNTGAGNAGVNLNNVVGTTALSLVFINGTGAEGIVINNSGQVNIGSGAGTSTIDGTTGDGLKTTNTDTFVDTVVFGNLASIGGNGYTALMSDGVSHTLDITNSGFSNITGKGVSVTNSGAGHTVFSMTSTGIVSTDTAVDLRKTGAGALDVDLGNNSFTSSAGMGLYVDGSAGAGLLSVTNDFQNSTSGATGGQIFESVTFDSDTSTAGIQQVLGGATTITTSSGDGLRMNNVLGDIAFTTLNITNDNGTGLYIRDAAGKGGSFNFSNTGGFINTTNGAAMDIDPVTMNSTFSSVSSTNANGQGISSAANGINLDTISGTVTINGGSITGAQGDSFVVTGGNALVTYSGDITATTVGQSAVTIKGGNTGTVTFNTGTISATDGTGLQFNNADGTYNFNGTTTLNGGNAGIDIVNGSAGVFTFGTGTSITSPTGTAFNMDSSTANVTYSGDITQASNAALVSITNESAGTVTFNTGTLSASNGTGIEFTNVDGNVNFNGTTTLTGGSVIDIETNSDGTFVFGTGTSITDGTGDAFRYGNGAGNVTYNGNITQTVATNGLVFITGQSGGTITFQNGTLTGSAGTGMAFNNVDGNVNFLGTTSLTDSQIGIGNNSAGTFNFASGTSLTNSAGLTPFSVANSSANITYSGNLTHSNAITAAVLIQNESAGTITFNTGTINITNGTGIQLDNVDSIVNFNGTTTMNGGDAGVDILNGSAGTFTFGSGTTITNPTGSAFNEDTSTANVTFNGTILKNNNTQNAVRINAKTGGTTALNGQITASTSTGNAINLLNNTGGTINFNNTSGSTSNITTTSGNSFNFTGGGTLNLTGNNYVVNSTSGSAFNATAGTVTATGTGNTVTSTTGRAVNINGATIGAGGVTFRSVNANGGTTSAIVLSGTGAGNFTVTGDGTAAVGAQGGNASGGTIQNITGADAISLNNVGGTVSLNSMSILNITASTDATDAKQTLSGVDAIQGTGTIGGLSLVGVKISNTSDMAINGPSGSSWGGLTINNSLLEKSNRYGVSGKGDSNNEGMVMITGLNGTASITNSKFDQGAALLDLTTQNSGNLNFTATNNTFSNSWKGFNSAGDSIYQVGSYAVRLQTQGSATMTAIVGDVNESNPALGNTFTNDLYSFYAGHVNSADTGLIKVLLSENTFAVTNHLSPTGAPLFTIPYGSVLLAPRGVGNMDATVSNNTFDQTFDTAGLAGSLSVAAEGGTNNQVKVTGNNFINPWDRSMELRVNNGAVLTALVSGNTYSSTTAGGAGTDSTAFTGPYDANRFWTLNNSTLNLTWINETDSTNESANRALIQTSNAGDTLNVFLNNLAVPNGYTFANGGTMNLYRNGSVSATIQGILQDNNVKGGGGSAATSPPNVSTSGTINFTNTPVTQPSYTIP